MAQVWLQVRSGGVRGLEFQCSHVSLHQPSLAALCARVYVQQTCSFQEDPWLQVLISS
jgi:hypothetical protein